MTEDVVLTEEEKEALERKRLAEIREKRKRKREFVEKYKVIAEWVFVISLFCGTAFFYFGKFVNFSVKFLERITVLNQTTNQMSQIIDNIRMVYTIHTDEKVTTMKRLIEIGAIPPTMVDHGEIINPYGGNVIIEASYPLENVEEAVESPTFKMSYQGLSHETCVSLARMDWGDKVKGLLAVAIGSVDEEGVDKALVDIDKKFKPEKPVEFIDRRGRRRIIRPRKRYQLNVAKPGDSFMPTPFSKDNAIAGCNCYSGPECSFALRYTVFGVDKPNRGIEDLSEEEKIIIENLKKKRENNG